MGQVSDHKSVVVESLFPRPKTFTWEVHEYLEITKQGTNDFIEKLAREDWTPVLNNSPDVDKMVHAFHTILDGHLYSCFRWK